MLVPEQRDHLHQRAVAGGLGNREMEAAIGEVVLLVACERATQVLQGSKNPIDVRILRVLRGGGRNLRFDQRTGAQQLERPRAGTLVGKLHILFGRQHIDAGAAAHFHLARELERNHRFAYAGPAHVEALRQVALGRQARAGRERAVAYQRRDARGKLAIEAAGNIGGVGRHRLFQGAGNILILVRSLAKWSGQFPGRVLYFAARLSIPRHPVQI